MSKKVVNSTIKQLLICIQKHYPIGEIIDYKEIEGWGGTLRLKLVSTDGIFFLKEKINYLTLEEFTKKVTINYYLSLYKLPVVPVLSTYYNKFTIQYKKKHYELLQWITGNTLYKTPEHLRLLSRNIGLLQLKSKNILTKIAINPTWNIPINRQKLFPDIPIFIKKYLRFFFTCKISHKFNLQLINKIVTLNEKFMNSINWSKLPNSWIHGDPGLDNVLINCKGEIYLFDLDNFRYSYKIWDLARMVAIIAGFNVKSSDYKCLNLVWDNCNLTNYLIDGFNSSYPLTSYEKEIFPYMVAINHIINFIAEFDLDDSYDHTFICFNEDMNKQLLILIDHLEYLIRK